jgi:hypothetical protein
MHSLHLALLALSFASLVAAAPSPPANIYTWSADFVSPSDWYQTNITSGRVFNDFRSPNAANTLWAGANGLNKIELCSSNNSTLGYYGQGYCSQMECVGGRCGGSYCSCRTPCDAFAMLCSLQTARYSGSCRIGGIVGDLWNVVSAVSVCMSKGMPLGIIIYGSEVVVRFSNFSTLVPGSTWQLPSYCKAQCA